MTGETYHILFCPNTFPIAPGKETTLIGKPNKPLRDDLEKAGKFGMPWFFLITQKFSDTISYTAKW